MGLKLTAAAAGLSALAGAGAVAWLLWPNPPRIPESSPAEKPPEIGREIPSAQPVQLQPIVIETQAPAQDAARWAEIEAKYGQAVAQAVADALARAGLPAAGGNSSSPTVAPVELAEKRIGPGPRGDSADVLALLPCPGCPVDLIARWLPPDAPEPRPMIARLREARWYAALGGELDHEASSGQIVAGWSAEAGYQRDTFRTGSLLHGWRASAGYGPTTGFRLFAGYQVSREVSIDD